MPLPRDGFFGGVGEMQDPKSELFEPNPLTLQKKNKTKQNKTKQNKNQKHVDHLHHPWIQAWMPSGFFWKIPPLPILLYGCLTSFATKSLENLHLLFFKLFLYLYLFLLYLGSYCPRGFHSPHDWLRTRVHKKCRKG